jgi:hypothetical protein
MDDESTRGFDFAVAGGPPGGLKAAPTSSIAVTGSQQRSSASELPLGVKRPPNFLGPPGHSGCSGPLGGNPGGACVRYSSKTARRQGPLSGASGAIASAAASSA